MIYQESRWTKPSDWCPKPGFWSSTDPQSTEIEVSELVGAFVRALQPGYVVETGTCLGQTAQAIGLALQANGHGFLDTLEISGERVTYASKRCEGLPVMVFQTESLVFEPMPVALDFLWLDSLLELRIPEFERYRPWMHNRTVVGFHDTAPHQAGTLGEDIFKIPGTRAIRLHTPRGVTFLEVL